MENDLRIRIMDTLERASAPSATGSEMLTALRELDAMAKDPAMPLPGDLRHYLSRRSYEKARTYLLGSGPIPPGDCGRGAKP